MLLPKLFDTQLREAFEMLSAEEGNLDAATALHFAQGVELEELLVAANALREQAFGNKIELCAILNAKCGNCGMDCTFCSQSSHHASDVQTFPLLQDDAIEEATRNVAATPITRFGLVTSGGSLTGDELSRLTQKMHALSRVPNIRVCGSLGRLNRQQMLALKDAGLERFHHNLETSEAFYPNVCTTQSWQSRFETILQAQQVGLEVCSGGLFGLGESWSDRIALAITLREASVTGVPLNFLHRHPGTPLADIEPLTADEALRIVAIYRLLLPCTTLRICGGRTTILGERQYEVFRAGANALMTGDYLTTSGESLAKDLAAIEQLGLEATS